jgi:anti-sigma B factor antagonist
MTEFSVETREEGGAVVIDVQGRVDAFLVTKIREVINEFIQQEKILLIIHFKRVAQINSTALGILIGRLRRVRMHGGDIKIVELSPEIRRVFDVMGASRIFDIHDTVESARLAFGLDPLPAAASSAAPPV